MKGIGNAAVILMFLIITIIAGGYFVYKTSEDVRNWITNTFNITLPDENYFISPISLARDNERRESVKAIADSIFQYTSEHKGNLPKDYPTAEKCIGTGSGCYNLKAILVPDYIEPLPKDPQTGTEENTGFTTF